MFGSSIVCYLFLGGTGAGACSVLALLTLFVPRERLITARADAMNGDETYAFSVSRDYRSLFAPVYAAALLVLFLGVVFLLIDIGRIDRIAFLFLHPQFTYISIGAYALALGIVFAAVLTCVWGGFVRHMTVRLLNVLSVVMMLVALLIMLYTGLLLQSVRAVPLWNTVWLPVLFVLSSSSCGFALVLAVAQFTGAGKTFFSVLHRMLMADVGIIILEIVVSCALVATVSMGATGITSGTALGAEQSLGILLQGQVAFAFWAAFVGLGLLLPLITEAFALRVNRLSPASAMGLAASVLVGGFALRWCLVEAGMQPVLLATGLQ